MNRTQTDQAGATGTATAQAPSSSCVLRLAVLSLSPLAPVRRRRRMAQHGTHQPPHPPGVPTPSHPTLHRLAGNPVAAVCDRR